MVNGLKSESKISKLLFIRDYGRGMSFEERYANSRKYPKMMVYLLTCLGMDTVNALSSCMNMSIYDNGIVKPLEERVH